jgi:hypothetical protein
MALASHRTHSQFGLDLYAVLRSRGRERALWSERAVLPSRSKEYEQEVTLTMETFTEV